MTRAGGTVAVTPPEGTDTWLVTLAGEHDTSTVPMLDLQTEPVWAEAAHVVVDLSRVEFIDSSVLGWLLRAARALEANGAARMELIEDPGGFASRILDITGLRRAITDPAPASEPTPASSGDGLVQLQPGAHPGRR
jgi:anti-anti-sigma factor